MIHFGLFDNFSHATGVPSSVIVYKHNDAVYEQYDADTEQYNKITL